MQKTAATINLKDFNKYKPGDITPGLNVQLHNGAEAVHLKVLRLDPKGTGKFIGELTTYFIRDVAGLKKGDLVMANVKNIDIIYN